MSTEPGVDSLFFPYMQEGACGPDFRLERMLMRRGRRYVAGVDEAGRGPLAGPVVAAAVILDPNRLPSGIDDSKRLDAPVREELFEKLVEMAQLSWCSVDAATIDRINIRQATLHAMHLAVSGLALAPDAILVDGRDVPHALREKGQAVVRGDAVSLSIAAASIIAKVVRDRMMKRAAIDHPGYGFASHKGYSTARHLDALADLGPCILHRRSFAPVTACLSEPGKNDGATDGFLPGTGKAGFS